jgi:hypothetical protein
VKVAADRRRRRTDGLALRKRMTSRASQLARGTLIIATVCNGSQQFAKLTRPDDAEMACRKATGAQEGPQRAHRHDRESKAGRRPPCGQTPQQAITGLWRRALPAATTPCPNCHVRRSVRRHPASAFRYNAGMIENAANADPPDPAPKPRRRRWLQFSLRTLLVCVGSILLSACDRGSGETRYHQNAPADRRDPVVAAVETRPDLPKARSATDHSPARREGADWWAKLASTAEVMKAKALRLC